jgi:uncharacterized UBP type Zn finger protein
MPECTHLNQVKDVGPRSQGCEACMKEGGWWVRLRVCLTCGHVGCCDTSPKHHALAHYKETGHPIMASHEIHQENMRWCYVDEIPV